MGLHQLSMFDGDHDGKTYASDRDKARLNAQLTSVFKSMQDGNWRTLDRIHAMTGAPEASISARLRDLRKDKFGGHDVERRYVRKGLYEYRVVVNGKH